MLECVQSFLLGLTVRAEIEDVDCPINSIGNFLHYNDTVYTLVKNDTVTVFI